MNYTNNGTQEKLTSDDDDDDEDDYLCGRVLALRRRWVSILQQHVRDQLVFGRRRFGPGSHCQKHGLLELKGTKSKVYAAINTDQIWLYKSEQVRQVRCQRTCWLLLLLINNLFIHRTEKV